MSNSKKGRIKQHSELKEWIPLYIGKSKNIGNRLREYRYLGRDNKTYALKLQSRDHLKDDRFRISTVRIDVINFDWIMPVAERYFRNERNPIIGRQKKRVF